MAQIILDSNNNLIQGDFDNATLNNRTKLQTTTTNATTNVYVVPNGSSTSAGVSVANNSSLTNASKIVMATNGTTDTQIISGVNGSGSYLPMSFYTNNALGMQLSTAGVLTVTGGVAGSSLPAGSVIQVVSTTKTDTFSSATVNAWTDVTGLSVSITPSSSSNKILVMASVQGINTTSNAYFRLVRGATAIGVGATAGSRSSASSSNIFSSANVANGMLGSSFQFLDSPSTTSSTTYKIQFITDVATTYVNRTAGDSDFLYVGRSQSTITVMEIKA
jgi:hypothetical protein